MERLEQLAVECEQALRKRVAELEAALSPSPAGESREALRKSKQCADGCWLLHGTRTSNASLAQEAALSPSPAGEGPGRTPHTCHGGMNPPFPYPCKACEDESRAEVQPPADAAPAPVTTDICQRCGGLHLFDTAVPSVIWNRVVRGRGLPDFLCLACIIEAFESADESFTATLWGRGFDGCPIEVRIRSKEAQDAALIQEENNALRWKLHGPVIDGAEPVLTPRSLDGVKAGDEPGLKPSGDEPVRSTSPLETASDETLVMTIHRDEDGDYICRDILRPGFALHADTEVGAVGKVVEDRHVYDEMIRKSAQPPADADPAPVTGKREWCESCGEHHLIAEATPSCSQSPVPPALREALMTLLNEFTRLSASHDEKANECADQRDYHQALKHREASFAYANATFVVKRELDNALAASPAPVQEGDPFDGHICESCEKPITSRVCRTADDVPLCESCAEGLTPALTPDVLWIEDDGEIRCRDCGALAMWVIEPAAERGYRVEHDCKRTDVPPAPVQEDR